MGMNQLLSMLSQAPLGSDALNVRPPAVLLSPVLLYGRAGSDVEFIKFYFLVKYVTIPIIL